MAPVANQAGVAAKNHAGWQDSVTRQNGKLDERFLTHMQTLRADHMASLQGGGVSRSRPQQPAASVPSLGGGMVRPAPSRRADQSPAFSPLKTKTLSLDGWTVHNVRPDDKGFFVLMSKKTSKDSSGKREGMKTKLVHIDGRSNGMGVGVCFVERPASIYAQDYVQDAAGTRRMTESELNSQNVKASTNTFVSVGNIFVAPAAEKPVYAVMVSQDVMAALGAASGRVAANAMAGMNLLGWHSATNVRDFPRPVAMENKAAAEFLAKDAVQAIGAAFKQAGGEKRYNKVDTSAYVEAPRTALLRYEDRQSSDGGSTLGISVVVDENLRRHYSVSGPINADASSRQDTIDRLSSLLAR